MKGLPEKIVCAVMGNPIAHSLSPQIHHHFAKLCGLDLQYDRLLVDEAHFEPEVRAFFAKGGRGLNITLPFKTRAYAMADSRTNRAESAKAANTLWMQEGLLHADNTDGLGLVADLSTLQDLHNKRVLILGAGGASRGIVMPLLETGLQCLLVVNRNEDRLKAFQQDFPKVQCISFQAIDNVGHIDVLINASSAGHQSETMHLPDALWTSQPFCYDLSYKQSAKTAFVQLAKRHGCLAKDGIGMLIEQAAASFYIWHGIKPQGYSVEDMQIG